MLSITDNERGAPFLVDAERQPGSSIKILHGHPSILRDARPHSSDIVLIPQLEIRLRIG